MGETGKIVAKNTDTGSNWHCCNKPPDLAWTSEETEHRADEESRENKAAIACRVAREISEGKAQKRNETRLKRVASPSN